LTLSARSLPSKEKTFISAVSAGRLISKNIYLEVRSISSLLILRRSWLLFAKSGEETKEKTRKKNKKEKTFICKLPKEK
jgi:hypothetical protein